MSRALKYVKSGAGNGFVGRCVGIGHDPHDHEQQQALHCQGGRPPRQRRRERREAERKVTLDSNPVHPLVL